MGLLTIDSIDTLDFKTSKKFQKKLKKAALRQLLKLFKANTEKKEFKKFPKFGFEIEGHLLNVAADSAGVTRYGLELHKEYLQDNKEKNFQIAEEFGRWMLELIPVSPLEDYLYSGNLLIYTQNLYRLIPKVLKSDNIFLSTTLPPKFGTPAYYPKMDPPLTSEKLKAMNSISNSPYMADEIINNHPRFPTFTQNVRIRRGENPQITAPIFKDTNTVMDQVLPGEKKPGEIHLDCFAFGMGMCSLQVTFGTATLDDARWLYDQYHIFTPIFVRFFHPACSECFDSIPQGKATRHRHALGVHLSGCR